MPPCLKSVLDQSVNIVNTIKTKALNTRLLKALCEEMGSEHTKLLFHTEVRWLSRGKVLTRLFELRDEVMLFLHHTDDCMTDCMTSSGSLNWHTWPMSLAFSML